MLIKLAQSKFLLVGVVLLFAAGYLWCFLNPGELQGEQHKDSHGSGNGLCFHFYNQTVHIVIPTIAVLMVLLSMILLHALGETLSGFTSPLIEPPRFLLA